MRVKVCHGCLLKKPCDSQGTAGDGIQSASVASEYPNGAALTHERNSQFRQGLTASQLLSRPPHRQRSERGWASGREGLRVDPRGHRCAVTARTRER
jgi:hypothetical protein